MDVYPVMHWRSQWRSTRQLRIDEALKHAWILLANFARETFMKENSGITTRHEQFVDGRPPDPDGGRQHTRLDSERTEPPRSPGRDTRVERWLLTRLFRLLGNTPLCIELWDGRRIDAPAPPPRKCLRIFDRRTLCRIARDPSKSFGDAYAEGRLEVEGSLLEFLRVLRDHFRPPRLRKWRQLWNLTEGFGAGARRRARARTNIHHHYDIGNEFYRLWLDERMLYTCAYYEADDTSLEQAQVAKMDHVCRKLQLKTGETVIEAGCGWGGFALHMAERYGVTVRAFNISGEQIAYARAAARAAGLEHKVEFIERDWREITGTCDTFVSIGMLEHVGVQNFGELGDVIHRCLHPAGRGLIHTIGRNYPAELDRWTERNIFPGAEPPALSQMMRIFERHDMSVLDVENMRLHYALTLKNWLDRFEWHVDEVREMFDERFIRMWRLYLAASVVAFEAGALQLFQVLFAPGGSNVVPWTRGYQYNSAEQTERGAAWRKLVDRLR